MIGYERPPALPRVSGATRLDAVARERSAVEALWRSVLANNSFAVLTVVLTEPWTEGGKWVGLAASRAPAAGTRGGRAQDRR
jgi:hypothetical protein